MAQQSNDLRERLLASLPQPENLAAYREETASLLAKHARALRWDNITAKMFLILSFALFLLWNHGPWRPGTFALIWLRVATAMFFFMGSIYSVRYEISEKQVATLKEIKQVQLQILELQASMRKDQ
jgi:hypothetical protein